MKTKAKKDYNAMSVDEATQCLSDFYQAQIDALTNPRKGPLRTLFSVAVNSYILTDHEDIKNLQDVVLAKNGITKIEAENVCHNYLAEVITATEARESNAAEGIKRYQEMTKISSMQARATPGYEKMGTIAQMTLKIRLFKENALKM